MKREAICLKILRARSVTPVARCSKIKEIKERHTHLESNMVIRHRRTVLALEQRDIYTHETLATFRLIPPSPHQPSTTVETILELRLLRFHRTIIITAMVFLVRILKYLLFSIISTKAKCLLINMVRGRDKFLLVLMDNPSPSLLTSSWPTTNSNCSINRYNINSTCKCISSSNNNNNNSSTCTTGINNNNTKMSSMHSTTPMCLRATTAMLFSVPVQR